MSSEQQTNELTNFEFLETSPEVLDEIIKFSRFIILHFSLLANFDPFSVRVPVIVPLKISTLFSINGAIS